MARNTSKDFDLVMKFADDYRIPRLDVPTSREAELRRMHRSVLGALQLWAEFDVAAKGGGLVVGGATLVVGDGAYLQLAESMSDLTSAFGGVLHGFVKPASMSLRSSIETFVRGASGASMPANLTETNVFALMAKAKPTPSFRVRHNATSIRFTPPTKNCA